MIQQISDFSHHKFRQMSTCFLQNICNSLSFQPDQFKMPKKSYHQGTCQYTLAVLINKDVPSFIHSLLMKITRDSNILFLCYDHLAKVPSHCFYSTATFVEQPWLELLNINNAVSKLGVWLALLLVYPNMYVGQPVDWSIVAVWIQRYFCLH